MEVTVNGQIIEIGNSLPAITRKNIDINNPSARFIDITNKFLLPDSNNNREIFESPLSVNSDSRSMDKLFDVVISDVFQLFRGKGFVENTSKGKLSLQVVDNSSELFKALDINLSSINWDDKDTELSTSAIDLLDSADIETCWFWGKACNHKNHLIVNTDQTTGNARCKYSRPSFYVQGLLKRAISLQGFSFVSPLPDLAFSACHADFLFTGYQKTLSEIIDVSTSHQLDGLDDNDFIIDFSDNDTNIVCDNIKHKWVLRGDIITDAAFIFRVVLSSPLEDDEIIDFFINQDDTYVNFVSGELNRNDPPSIIEFFLIGTGQIEFKDTLLYTLHSEINEDLDLSTNPFLGYKIKAFDNLPDLTYLDLFKLICVVSNQYQNVDFYNKICAFNSLANINKMNSVNWSDKFIIGSEKILTNFPGLAQKNWLKYENDKTVNKFRGWSYFETDNKKLAAEIDYITLKFGASTETIIVGNTIVCLHIYEDTKRIPEQEINIRLFAINGSCLIFTPIDWTNLVQNYYANWFNSLYRIRLIECQMNLSKLDVLKWNQKQLVYIDYFESTFIVLEISNFIPGRLTKVKLLNYGR